MGVGGPKVWITGVGYDQEFTFTKFTVKFYVDDIRLEHGERGERVNAEVYREIIRHLKQAQFIKNLDSSEVA